jgi:hypothetical protein
LAASTATTDSGYVSFLVKDESKERLYVGPNGGELESWTDLGPGEFEETVKMAYAEFLRKYPRFKSDDSLV